MAQGNSQPNVNIKKVASVNAQSGSGTSTGALRVELPTNGTGVIATVGAVTAITNALPAGNNNIGDVDIASSVLPTGASTSANQTTQITAEQAIQTAVELIDDTVATLGTTTYTEATTKGITIGAVRRDADTTLVNTTNEVAPLQVNAAGQLKTAVIVSALPTGAATSALQTQPGVDIGDVTINNASGAAAVNIQDGGNSITVDGTITETNSAAILTSVQLIDDTVTAQGTALGTTKTELMGASVTTAAPTYTTGQISPVNQTTSGAIRVDIGATSVNATAIKVDGSAATQPVSGTVAVSSVVPGTAATNLGKAEDSPHTTGDVGVMTLGVRNDAGTALANADQDYVPHTMNSQGGMWVAPLNFVSTSNSTSTPLAASATFTGTSESCVNFALIAVSAYSNQLSGFNGLSIQQSSDGTNWDISDSYSVPSFSGKVYSVQPGASFYRVVYTNGPIAQTAFRLQTVLHSVYSKPSSQKAMDMYTSETDLEQTQAFNMLLDPNQMSWNMARGDIQNGAWTNVKQMPVGYSTDPVVEQLIQLNAQNPNFVRQLDQYGREKVAPPDETYTYSVTLTGSTTETTLIPGISNTKIRLVGLVIANSSASTNSLITIRDFTGTSDVQGIQYFESVGGGATTGFMGGFQRVTQRTAGGNWTVQCATSTTSIYVTAYYQLT